MKVGLYFGTFNPIHNGHLVVADYMATQTDLDEVWLVVSPQNPLKKEEDLLEDNLRLNLVKMGIQQKDKIQVSDIEFELPIPSFTYQSLLHIQTKYQDYEFVLIIGEDNLASFTKWRNHQEIADNFEIYVYPRKMEDSTLTGSQTETYYTHKNVKLFDVPMIPISSTDIRSNIKNTEYISRFLPQSVCEEVQKNQLYY